MSALAFSWTHARVVPHAIKRALFAGSLWGIAFGFGLIVLKFWQCGTICLPDAPLTVLFSTVAGILTIGPLAAFGRQASPVPNTRKQS